MTYVDPMDESAEIEISRAPSSHLVRSIIANRGFSAVSKTAEEVVILFLTDTVGRSMVIHVPKGLARALEGDIHEQLAAIDASLHDGELK